MPPTFADVYDAKYLLLTTFTKNGTPKPTAIWGVPDGDRLLVITDRVSWKVKRIRNIPRVTIAECGVLGKPKGDAVEATARVLPDSEIRGVYNNRIRRSAVSTTRCCAATGSTRGGSICTAWSVAVSTRCMSRSRSPRTRTHRLLSGSSEPVAVPTRCHCMVMRTIFGYAVVELAVLAALTWSLGLGWTLLILLATSVVGVALAGSQVKRQILRLQRARTDPQGAVADGLLVALGTVLVFIPGLVTTALGALMLLPPTRSVVRPLAGALLTRGIARRVTVVNLTASGYPGRGDYIDGEVVEERAYGRVHDANIVPRSTAYREF